MSIRLVFASLAVVWGLLFCETAIAGMPAPLPTGWTKDTPVDANEYDPNEHARGEARWQAISFFAAILILSTWGVKLAWNSLQVNFPALPKVGYPGAGAMVLLWGILFVIVLTMISGARELMTPGAWRKQGWTYNLNESLPPVEKSAAIRAKRRGSLEQLRTAFWQYAATHEGRFPYPVGLAMDPSTWRVIGDSHFRFHQLKDRRADESGQLLVYEVNGPDDERLVLLTNGLLGTMTAEQIQRIIAPKSDAGVEE